jgi:hypothetical protein
MIYVETLMFMRVLKSLILERLEKELKEKDKKHLLALLLTKATMHHLQPLLQMVHLDLTSLLK